MRDGLPDLLHPAACLAAQNQRHEILRYCNDEGVDFDVYLTRACRAGAKTPEMLEFLLSVNWSNIRNSVAAVQDEIDWFKLDSFQGGWLKEYALKVASENERREKEKQYTALREEHSMPLF